MQRFENTGDLIYSSQKSALFSGSLTEAALLQDFSSRSWKAPLSETLRLAPSTSATHAHAVRAVGTGTRPVLAAPTTARFPSREGRLFEARSSAAEPGFRPRCSGPEQPPAPARQPHSSSHLGGSHWWQYRQLHSSRGRPPLPTAPLLPTSPGAPRGRGRTRAVETPPAHAEAPADWRLGPVFFWAQRTSPLISRQQAPRGRCCMSCRLV